MDNPQAFPRQKFVDEKSGASGRGFPGMTLRDYFAGQYLSTYVDGGSGDANTIAYTCYVVADAMLKERSK